MSLSICILASGSSGNCAVVRTAAGVMLIDAGLSPRATAQRMSGTGASFEQIEAICLTHLDCDHLHRGWRAVIEKSAIRVYCSPTLHHQLATYESAFAGFVRPFDDAGFEPMRGCFSRAVSLKHDDFGSSAFVVSAGSTALGYATDLGRVPPVLIEAFAGVDLLAIESNYDPAMQLQSGRPAFLKNRIMGGRGHLSNHEAFDAVVRIMDASEKSHGKLPSHVVLLHRSDECNCPTVVRKLFSRDARLVDRLVLAEQHCRSEWLAPAPRPTYLGEQLRFEFGSLAG